MIGIRNRKKCYFLSLKIREYDGKAVTALRFDVSLQFSRPEMGEKHFSNFHASKGIDSSTGSPSAPRQCDT